MTCNRVAVWGRGLMTPLRRVAQHGICHRNEVFRRYVSRSLEEVEEEGTHLPGHLRMCLEPTHVRLAAQLCSHEEEGRVRTSGEAAAVRGELVQLASLSMEAAKQIRWTKNGLQSGGHEDEEEDVGRCCCLWGDGGEASGSGAEVRPTPPGSLSAQFACSPQNLRQAGCRQRQEGEGTEEGQGQTMWCGTQHFPALCPENGILLCSVCSPSAAPLAVPYTQGLRWDQSLVDDPKEAADILLNCSAVVGMHPDQVAPLLEAVRRVSLSHSLQISVREAEGGRAGGRDLPEGHTTFMEFPGGACRAAPGTLLSWQG